MCNPTCMRLCIALPFVYNVVSKEMETQLYGRLTCAPSMGCLSISRSRSSMAWLAYWGTVVGFGINKGFIFKVKVATFSCVTFQFNVRY